MAAKTVIPLQVSPSIVALPHHVTANLTALRVQSAARAK